jgi:hypothetical protein
MSGGRPLRNAVDETETKTDTRALHRENFKNPHKILQDLRDVWSAWNINSSEQNPLGRMNTIWWMRML